MSPSPAHPNNCAASLARRNPLSVVDLLSLAVVCLLGLGNLPQPFWSDQAQYTLAAENLSEGIPLYRDLWDVKQPGIVYFYFAGGWLFGFNEIGIHFFELIWMMLFAVVLLVTLKPRFKDNVVASLLPFVTVGAYYGTTSGFHLTQPEPLMGFPTFLTLWFAYKGVQPESRRLLWLFLSGLMGGIVLVLKFMFLPIPVSFWLVALARHWYANPMPSAFGVLQAALAIGLGACVPLLLMAVHLWYQGVLPIAMWTFFVYPPLALAAWPLGINIGTLTDSVTWFLRNFGPVLGLGIVGAYSRLARRRDYLTLSLVLWIAAGVFVILLQRLSWFQSHFMLLVVPLGILAARGVDALLPRWQRAVPFAFQRSRWVALASVVLLLSPLWTSAAARSAVLVRDRFATLLTKDELLIYQSAVSKDYEQALRETAFLKNGESEPGPIYVIGDALYYYVAGRDPAIPILVRHFVPPFLWAKLVSALHRTPRPPYIFIAAPYLANLRKHTPEAVPYIDATARFVYTHYNVLRVSDAGTWFVLRELDGRPS